MINDDFNEAESAPKSKRGRRSHQSISRKPANVRLYNGDRIHIEKTVRQLKHSDPDFATEGAAVRYYVGVGIAAEKDAFDSKHTIANSVMKRVGRSAVLDQMKPLADAVGDLLTHLIKSSDENSRFFADITRRTEAIEATIGGDDEIILKLFTTLIETNRQSSKNEEQMLKSLLVLKSIIYLFLLSRRTGVIKSDDAATEAWRTRIDAARRLANELSAEEVKLFSEELLESEFVMKTAREIRSQESRLRRQELLDKYK